MNTRLSLAALKEAGSCLKTLGHPARLRLLERLSLGPCTVGELAEDARLAQPAVSGHLRLLERCGFVASAREGKWVRYSIARPHVGALLDLIRQHFDRNPPRNPA